MATIDERVDCVDKVVQEHSLTLQAHGQSLHRHSQTLSRLELQMSKLTEAQAGTRDMLTRMDTMMAAIKDELDEKLGLIQFQSKLIAVLILVLAALAGVTKLADLGIF